MRQLRTLPLGTAVLFGAWVLTMIAALVLWRSCASDLSPPSDLIGVVRPVPTALQPFQLFDQNGEALDRSRLQGRWTMVFFGYTHCPDVCPATLSVVASVMRELRERDRTGGAIQSLFVSVDPERDTADRLAEYAGFFDPDMIAASGTVDALDALARQFGAGYVIEPETAPGQYLVVHTSAIFLTDPSARLVAVFSQPHSPETIVTQFERIRTLVED